VKKGDTLELNIVKLGLEGKGIAKINRNVIKSGSTENSSDNYVVFVSGTYPGDKVIAQLRKIKKSFAEASPLKILSPSKERTLPVCSHFGICGGCKQQNLIYESQVKYKEQLVRETFEHIGTFHQRKQAHGGGLLEGFLWHSCCQDNRISRMTQVTVSPVGIRRTEFFGGTGVRAIVFRH